jgi:hypothetical protein
VIPTFLIEFSVSIPGRIDLPSAEVEEGADILIVQD